MSESIISLKNVSKCFKRYAKPVDRLKELLLPGKSHADVFWALQDINLEIFKGETLGVVGRNGAGKSTLLQLITKTLTPTTGEIGVHGRISALLELGSGFNPEFTGRQNVFFNGRILGLTRAEIEAKFDEITAFANIGDFIDQPVKTYSSGMFVRLAFAVAVNTNPDILIVDEALAVGDIFFQQKCFDRLRQMKEAGVTLLFVSHDSSAVCKLCHRAILIEHGRIVLDALPRQVVDLYQAKFLQQQDVEPELTEINVSPSFSTEDGASSTISLTSEAVIIQFVRFFDEDDQEIYSITSDSPLQLSIGILFREEIDDPHVGFIIRTRMGEVIFESNTFCMGRSMGTVSAGTLLNVRFRFKVPLIPQDYTITTGVSSGGVGEHQFERSLAVNHDTAVLKVLRNQDTILWNGVVNLNPTVTFSKQSSLENQPFSSKL
ncbi:MAG: ABC transporter ATP-binding protein [Myxacorys californica WJT36-NPBG1]|jgi:lipopolysaccharide transport system ATP-binding protein|nr:ABC transporter ATP-binding protein [Myxacorys californica WJT36-NPBG1]